MADAAQEPSPKLAKIFAKINMSELPAMSGNVQELIALSNSSRSAAYDLAKVILKDYSLTNKVLQVVNSAYYALSQHVSSISKAVTILGFDAVRDLAMAIALFEDFIKAGVEKEEISKLLTRSFLSGLQARELVVSKNFSILPEEAFICALLHHLGKIITCIYLPDTYGKIQDRVELGMDEERICRELLDDMSFAELGIEVAKFWNMSDKIIDSMEVEPSKPKNKSDTDKYLQNIVAFTNSFTDTVCDGGNVKPLLKTYGKMMNTKLEEMVELFGKSVEASEDISDSIRYGLSKLDIHRQLDKVEERTHGPERGKSRQKKESQQTMLGEGKARRHGMKLEKEIEELEPLPSSSKSVNDFIRELTETLMADRLKLDEFYINLLEALYRGIGFDRVVMAILSIQSSTITVQGRYGLGDIDASGVNNFEHPMNNRELAIPRCLAAGKDMAIPPNSLGAFPEKFKYLVKNRMVYLFPICLDKKPIALLYLDRKIGRPKLDGEDVKSTRLLRDFAVMAIRKMREQRK